MAFDLAAARNFIRYLVNDANVETVDNATMLSSYINPAYQDWWQRVERRPGAQINGTIATFAANDRTEVGSGSSIDQSTIVEHVFVQPTVSGGNYICSIGDFNRIRTLQETEGLTGIPREIGMSYVYNDPSLTGLVTVVLAAYPLPSEATTLTLYGAGKYTPLVNDTDTMKLDPVSARYVARLAAYRAAISAYDLPPNRVAAITSGLPGWVKAMFQIDVLIHEQGVAQELAPHARPEGFNA